MAIRLIKLAFGVLFCIILLNVGTVSANEKDEKVISHNQINEFLPNESHIVERALQGDTIDTEYTKVNLIENKEEGTKTVEIDRVLSETEYQNGQVETENEKTSIILSSSSGRVDETTYPSSSSASVRVVINYTKKTFKQNRTVKMTSFSVTPRSLDSQFSLTTLRYEAVASGSGFLSNGKSTSKTETTGRRTVSSPTSGTAYSRSISSWVKYVDTVAGVTGVEGSLTYKRNLNGNTYSFNYNVGP